MKLVLSFVVGVFLVFLPLPVFAQQQVNFDKEKAQEEQIKQFIMKHKDSGRLRVHLKNGYLYRAYVVEANDQNFTTLAYFCFQYSEVEKVKLDSSKTKKLKKAGEILLLPVLVPVVLILRGCCG